MTRRDLAWLLPILAAAQGASPERSMPAHSGVLRFDALTVSRSPNGNETRPVLRGKLPTGEFLEVHETTLQPGQMPHPAHKHRHTELMLIREGKLDMILDGTSEPLSPGDVAYCASGELHGLKNSGTEPARYFVVAIGEEPAGT